MAATQAVILTMVEGRQLRPYIAGIAADTIATLNRLGTMLRVLGPISLEAHPTRYLSSYDGWGLGSLSMHHLIKWLKTQLSWFGSIATLKINFLPKFLFLF